MILLVSTPMSLDNAGHANKLGRSWSCLLLDDTIRSRLRSFDHEIQTIWVNAGDPCHALPRLAWFACTGQDNAWLGLLRPVNDPVQAAFYLTADQDFGNPIKNMTFCFPRFAKISSSWPRQLSKYHYVPGKKGFDSASSVPDNVLEVVCQSGLDCDSTSSEFVH